MVCRDLEELGIVLDAEANQEAVGCVKRTDAERCVSRTLLEAGEAKISAAASRVQIWVVPTNEELIVARQAAQLLSEGQSC